LINPRNKVVLKQKLNVKVGGAAAIYYGSLNARDFTLTTEMGRW
jgi:hypothetical protein